MVFRRREQTSQVNVEVSFWRQAFQSTEFTLDESLALKCLP